MQGLLARQLPSLHSHSNFGGGMLISLWFPQLSYVAVRTNLFTADSYRDLPRMLSLTESGQPAGVYHAHIMHTCTPT